MRTRCVATRSECCPRFESTPRVQIRGCARAPRGETRPPNRDAPLTSPLLWQRARRRQPRTRRGQVLARHEQALAWRGGQTGAGGGHGLLEADGRRAAQDDRARRRRDEGACGTLIALARSRSLFLTLTLTLTPTSPSSLSLALLAPRSGAPRSRSRPPRSSLSLALSRSRSLSLATRSSLSLLALSLALALPRPRSPRSRSRVRPSAAPLARSGWCECSPSGRRGCSTVCSQRGAPS